MSRPTIFFRRDDGLSQRATPLSFDSEKDVLLSVIREFSEDGTFYVEKTVEIALSSVIMINWEAHSRLNGVLKDRFPCDCTGYGADQKAEIAIEEGYMVR